MNPTGGVIGGKDRQTVTQTAQNPKRRLDLGYTYYPQSLEATTPNSTNCTNTNSQI